MARIQKMEGDVILVTNHPAVMRVGGDVKELAGPKGENPPIVKSGGRRSG
jgi:hypothetical protein